MELFDAYGRPVLMEILKKEQAAPTLAGIRNIYSVIDDSIGLTPEKAVGIMRQAEFGDPWLYLELAERMEEKDLLYQAVLHTRKMAVSQLEIEVTAAGDEQFYQDDADFIRDILIESNQIDLHDVIVYMLDALGKGFNVSEIVWDTDGNNQHMQGPTWLPFQVKWRDPRWFMFDWISGEQLLVRTLNTAGPEIPVGASLPEMTNYWRNPLNPSWVKHDTGGAQIGIQPASQPLAPFKFITHITKAKAGLPIRGGLARIVIWAYLFKNYVLKDWVTFAEVYGQPMRLGKYGPGATENDKAALLRAVTNIGTDSAAIIPESMAIEFVESRGGGQKSHEMYAKLCEYVDKMVTIGILGQELTTQLPKGTGSRAAAQVHDVVRRDIATDDAIRIAATLNRDLVKPLIDLNRGPRRRYPLISIGYKEELDQTNFMTYIAAAADHGVRIGQKWVREQLNVPDPEPDEELLQPVTRIAEQSAPESGPNPNMLPPKPKPGFPPPNGGPPYGTAPGQPGSKPDTAPPKPGQLRSGEPAASIANPSLAPAYTDVNGRVAGNGHINDRELHHSDTFTGNPEAVAMRIEFKGGSKDFQLTIEDAVEGLPLGAKQLLRNWTIEVIESSPEEWIGQTDPDNHVIRIAEQWKTGEINDDPPQVVRHEVGHAAADQIKNKRQEWWDQWIRVVQPEVQAQVEALKSHGFEYMLKSPDEAFAEMFSYELAHSADAEDEHYRALRDILPHSFSLMESLVRPFGADDEVAKDSAETFAQKKRAIATLREWARY